MTTTLLDDKLVMWCITNAQKLQATLKISRLVLTGSAFASSKSSRILSKFLVATALRAQIMKYKVNQTSHVMYNVKLRCANCKTSHVINVCAMHGNGK